MSKQQHSMSSVLPVHEHPALVSSEPASEQIRKTQMDEMFRMVPQWAVQLPALQRPMVLSVHIYEGMPGR